METFMCFLEVFGYTCLTMLAIMIFIYIIHRLFGKPPEGI